MAQLSPMRRKHKSQGLVVDTEYLVDCATRLETEAMLRTQRGQDGWCEHEAPERHGGGCDPFAEALRRLG